MNFNFVVQCGNLLKDPTMIFSKDGKAMCRFSIAVNPDRGAPSSSVPLFIQVLAYGKLGENCNEYLKKGQNCIVQGSLQQRSWQTSEGFRVLLQIFAHRVEFGPAPKVKEEGAPVDPAKPDVMESHDDGEPIPPDEPPDEDPGQS